MRSWSKSRVERRRKSRRAPKRWSALRSKRVWPSGTETPRYAGPPCHRRPIGSRRGWLDRCEATLEDMKRLLLVTFNILTACSGFEEEDISQDISAIVTTPREGGPWGSLGT